jgi:hypothetical protein
VDVQLTPKEQRTDEASVYAAKLKHELEPFLVGEKVKTVQVSILGSAEQAPLALVVTGHELDIVMVFAKAALNELRTNELPRGKPTGDLKTASTGCYISSDIPFLYLDSLHIFLSLLPFHISLLY